MTAELKSTSEGSTMVLTIANPTQRNALGPEIYAAGIEALNGAEGSAEIRSVVIVGEGAWFCAGGSLQRLLANRQLDRSVQAESIEGLHNWIDSIRTFPKPIIAAVEGAAAGAVFAASYSNVALSPDGGLSWHLGQQLPRQLASEWLMNGERIGAQRLHALGLVNELTETGQALQGALALAAKLNARAPNSLASIKELLSDARGATLASQLTQERDHFVRNLHHPNAGIGIAAFLDKKPPQYE
jgi:enoyl-CoA hydratase/carnithine racemase